MKEYPETHQQGIISIENIPEDVVVGTNIKVDLRELMQSVAFKGDFGIQIAKDGRVWVCINGLAFLRFSPHPNGKMGKTS